MAHTLGRVTLNWDLLCGTDIKIYTPQHRKLTLEKIILLLLLLGTEPSTFQSQVCHSTTELSPIIIHTKICWLLQSASYIIQSLWCSWSSLSYLHRKSVMLLSGLSYSHPKLLMFPSKACHAPIQSLMFPPKICHSILWVKCLSCSHPVSHVPTQNLSCSCPKSVMFPSKACHILAQLSQCYTYTLKWGEMS